MRRRPKAAGAYADLKLMMRSHAEAAEGRRSLCRPEAEEAKACVGGGGLRLRDTQLVVTMGNGARWLGKLMIAVG